MECQKRDRNILDHYVNNQITSAKNPKWERPVVFINDWKATRNGHTVHAQVPLVAIDYAEVLSIDRMTPKDKLVQ